MMNRLIAAILLPCILLASLALPPNSPGATRENPNTSLDSWLGRDRGDLIKAWGAPDQESRVQNGATSLLYHKGREIVLPGYHHEADFEVPAKSIVLKRDVNFQIDDDGKIVRGYWQVDEIEQPLHPVLYLIMGFLIGLVVAGLIYIEAAGAAAGAATGG
jgi:hypothetical protein